MPAPVRPGYCLGMSESGPVQTKAGQSPWGVDEPYSLRPLLIDGVGVPIPACLPRHLTPSGAVLLYRPCMSNMRLNPGLSAAALLPRAWPPPSWLPLRAGRAHALALGGTDTKTTR